MAIYLSPSMLSIDFTKVGEQLAIVEQAGVPYIHLDVMDGVFVPNISFGIPVIKGIRKASNMVFDAHLMIVDPERYVEQFRDAGAVRNSWQIRCLRLLSWQHGKKKWVFPMTLKLMAASH